MVSFFVQAIVSILAIMNPLGNLPVFLIANSHKGREYRKKAAKVVLVVLGVMSVFVLLRLHLLKWFDAMQMVGGVITFAIGHQLARVKSLPSYALQQKEERKNDAASFPSLISRSETIAAVTSLTASRNHRWMHVGVTFIAFASVLAVTFVVSFVASWVQGKLGSTGLALIARLMGLVLTVIALELVVTGLAEMILPWNASQYTKQETPLAAF
ncbi:MarC family protein [Shouchella shacheensis]|uniref:MarC family protein n=1 Tax=Shouchella shacheensis TaxID=1649580 RepID=UPI00073FBE56|nr:MarC family protein [Shouchella shacheensis]